MIKQRKTMEHHYHLLQVWTTILWSFIMLFPAARFVRADDLQGNDPTQIDFDPTRVIFDDFIIQFSFTSGFDCRASDAEAVRADFEDCLRVYAVGRCGFKPIYVGLGNAFCTDGDGVLIKGGVFTLEDAVPVSKEEVSSCVESAALSTMCKMTFLGSFPDLEDATYALDTPESTAAPTAIPTVSPTLSPTLSPTAVPTASPTLSPTAALTASPTLSPTAVPTASPSTSPSLAPTLRVSENPSASPSVMPSLIPSQSPSYAPSPSPTPEPTEIPTARPTMFPTGTPSTLPTVMPSAVPTILPSAIPSDIPSQMPSQSPTILPTAAASDNIISGIRGTENAGNSDNNSSAPMAVGTVAGGLLVLIIAAILLVRRRNEHSDGAIKQNVTTLVDISGDEHSEVSPKNAGGLQACDSLNDAHRNNDETSWANGLVPISAVSIASREVLDQEKAAATAPNDSPKEDTTTNGNDNLSGGSFDGAVDVEPVMVPVPKSALADDLDSDKETEKDWTKPFAESLGKLIHPLCGSMYPFQCANNKAGKYSVELSSHEGDLSTDYEHDRVAWDPDDASVASTDVVDSFQPARSSQGAEDTVEL